MDLLKTLNFTLYPISKPNTGIDLLLSRAFILCRNYLTPIQPNYKMKVKAMPSTYKVFLVPLHGFDIGESFVITVHAQDVGEQQRNFH